MRRSMADPNLVDAPYEQVQDLRRLSAGTAGVGDVWRILWCRRGLIAATVIVCFLATLAYVLVARSQYTAVAQILIDPRDRQIVTRDVNPDTLAADGGVVQVESQARVIESDAVLLRAVKAAGLDRDPDYGAPQPTVLGRLLGLFTGAVRWGRPARGQGFAGSQKAPRGQTGRQGLRRRRGGNGL